MTFIVDIYVDIHSVAVSESCVRLVDVDDDGRMDILFGGLMIAFDADAFHTKADIKRYCLDNGWLKLTPICGSLKTFLFPTLVIL